MWLLCKDSDTSEVLTERDAAGSLYCQSEVDAVNIFSSIMISWGRIPLWAFMVQIVAIVCCLQIAISKQNNLIGKL